MHFDSCLVFEAAKASAAVDRVRLECDVSACELRVALNGGNWVAVGQRDRVEADDLVALDDALEDEALDGGVANLGLGRLQSRQRWPRLADSPPRLLPDRQADERIRTLQTNIWTCPARRRRSATTWSHDKTGLRDRESRAK